MAQIDGSDPESRDSLKTKNQKQVSEHDSNTLEFKAGIAAIITAVIGIGLVLILKNVVGIDDSATIVTLLIVPILVYGVVSGRLRELRGPGGWEMVFDKVNEIENTVQDIKGEAASAIKYVPAMPSEIKTQVVTEPENELTKLVEEYNNIRKEQKYGSQRTMNMTNLVRRLIYLAPQLVQFPINEYLKSDDRGERLAAYAYLYAQPNNYYFEELVNSVDITIHDYEAFLQYWGLQAISMNLPQVGQGPLSSGVITQLKSFDRRLPRGTDRDYLLRTILGEIGS